MSSSDRERWEAKYAEKALPGHLAPDDWLIEESTGMPPGRALELACGLGHNAIWLATQGWQVDAVDISPIGLACAAALGQRHSAHVNWIAADLDDFTPESAAYDLVVVFRFLDRLRLPRIVEQALRPGGRLIYETFAASHLARADVH